MVKRVTELDDDLNPVTYKNTRARRRSEAQLIPWSKGPRTRGQRIARALWG